MAFIDFYSIMRYIYKMRKQKIYLDTSVISNLFTENAPELLSATQTVFNDLIKPKVFDFYISGIVLDELVQTQNTTLRDKLTNCIKEYDLPSIDFEPFKSEIEQLAMQYIDRKALPAQSVNDALHVAIATFFEIDILLSWNFKHLANIQREHDLLIINLSEGYTHPIRIINPLEVAYVRE